MARMSNKVVARRNRSGSHVAMSLSPEARQHMIGEAAYYRYVQRGFEPGHDLEDWLAAEADFEREHERERRQALEPAAAAEFGMQQSGPSGRAADDLLKRRIRQHPRREIPRIESIEPEEAPLKE